MNANAVREFFADKIAATESACVKAYELEEPYDECCIVAVLLSLPVCIPASLTGCVQRAFVEAEVGTHGSAPNRAAETDSDIGHSLGAEATLRAHPRHVASCIYSRRTRSVLRSHAFLL